MIGGLMCVLFQRDQDLIGGLIKLSNILNSDLQQAVQHYAPLYKKSVTPFFPSSSSSEA